MLTQSHLFREIHEQPETIERLLVQEAAAIDELAGVIRDRVVDYVVIAARGTSDNAARYAQYVLGSMNGLTVALATPSLYSLYKRPPRLGNALVLGISQSGKSPDIVAVLAEARRQKALTAVITNDPDSDLGRQGDIVVDLNAGRERAVAATKTYTAELGAIAMLSCALAGDGQMTAALRQIPGAMADTLKMNNLIAGVAPRFRYMNRCVVIGRGYNYATAYEMALKMKELTYTIVEPYSSADFLHGPLAMVEQGFPVFVIAPAGVLDTEMGAFLDNLNRRQAETIAISDVDAILERARVPLPLPRSVPEWLSPLVTIIPGQLLSLHLAHTRDYDVDSPRSLKKVTETQ